MKKALFFILFITSITSFGQDYNLIIGDLIRENRYDKIPSVLNKWQKSEPDNSDMYIAFYNYYINKTESKLIRISSKDMNLNSGSPIVVYYNNFIHQIDSNNLAIANKYLNEGITKNPKRLDMYWLKISQLIDIGNIEGFFSEIYKLLDLNNDKKWKWLRFNDVLITSQEDVFNDRIANYINEILNHGIPHTTETIELTEKMIIQNPFDLSFYILLSRCYMELGEWDKALNLLRNINSKKTNSKFRLSLPELRDVEIKFLTARCYYELSDLKNAKKYYKKVVNHKYKIMLDQIAKDEITKINKLNKSK